jgi:diguanylate cyclase (GGDEF)-like protein
MQQTTLARVRRQPIGLILIAPDRVEDPGDPVVPPGRPFRDRALRRLRNAAMGSLRSSDVAVRWGPAEILILLPAVGIVMARHVAERIRDAVESSVARDMPALTVSGGVTELPSGSNPEAAVRRVRERLAEARKRGGNRIY